ncbi:hypothetical protein BC643_4671 [Mangrovibacterium diazotrophicum]|uniref:Uncharacterized protein n=1 Tax=Mangrovibacterium diazotrophicum TaxID=1261403 RepID=A0A419VUL1_9BACT|nr:hypothetical protein BC643_4671 [Mangrovibacterium diazotrophicum]
MLQHIPLLKFPLQWENVTLILEQIYEKEWFKLSHRVG